MRALILLFFLPLICFSQVGIGTTNPKASLDIQSSDATAPTNTDGLLIPKIDEYPTVNPTVEQDGMLVYATGNGSVVKGFYYWNNTTTSWVTFSGTTIQKIDDLIDGKSDNDGTNDGSSIFLGINAGANDDETNNYNVGFGIFSLTDNTSGSNNSAFGNRALGMNTTGSRNVGLGYNALYENTTGSDNIAIGHYAGFFETNSNRLYIENSSSTNPLIYGEFDNDLLRVNGDLEVEKPTDASITVKTPFGDKSSLKLFESGGSGDYGFEFEYDGGPDKFHLWSRTFAGNEGIRMTWLKNGRVGINDVSPTALLDIEATNSATPTNTDGILIPRIDAFPASNPTADQNGMLVFLTTDNTFYFWRNSTTNWVSINTSGSQSINDLSDGKSDDDGSLNGSSVFLGINAGLVDDSSDNRNVGIGFQALKNNISGTQNAAYGYGALIANITGNYNSAFGKDSMHSNTGTANSAFGFQSMYWNTTGTSNSAFGVNSLVSNTTGHGNTSIGVNSMYNNSIGEYNVVLGYSALRENTTGSNNIAIGYEAGYSETNSNRLYIENSSSTLPLIYGEFDNDLLRVNGDFEVEKTTDASITAKTPFGEKSSLKLFESGGSGDYGFEFQYDGTPDKLFLWSRTFAGNEGIRMTWLKNGRVGINNISPTALLDIEASNSATPTNTDGILIPRVDAFPSTNPNVNQNGMLVFLTADNSFYYWKNSSNSWEKLSTTERIDDLLDGKSDNDGSNNGSSIFIGINAGLTDNSTDNRNVAIGYQALEDNLNGTNNTAVGYQSLHNNRVDYNVAIGSRALFSTIVGNENTAVGYAALELNTGRYNTAVGYNALQSNTEGYGNTALGNQSLSSNTNGDSNIAIGYRSMLDNSSGGDNIAIGYHALQNNSSGDYNVAIGGNTSNSITTGSNNTAIGHGASALGANFYNTSAIGSGAAPNSPNQVRLGNASVTVIGGSANWSNLSDRRLKANIKEDIIGLDFIKKLRPVSYNLDMDAIARFEKTPDSLRLRDAEQLKAKEIQAGFIAQEVETAANEVGFDFHGIVKPYDSNGTYALRYAEFVVPLVKAMQEQQNIIESQQENINALKREMEEIKALLRQD